MNVALSHHWVGGLVLVPPPVLHGAMAHDATAAPREDAWGTVLETVARSQDRQAFAGLYAHFAPRVKAYMRRLGADDGRAEDLAQEVMLTVWRRAALYDRAQAAVSTWVFTIARNKRIDQFRRERRPEIDLDDPTLVADDQPAADTLLDRMRADGRLRDAIGTLPANQAEILRKNFFEDKPHGQIAEELGLPLGTVKSRVRLALTKLRQALQDMER